MKDFEAVKKQSINKKRINVQQEKRVLKMRQILAKAFIPHLEEQIRQGWKGPTEDIQQCPEPNAKFLAQKRGKFG